MTEKREGKKGEIRLDKKDLTHTRQKEWRQGSERGSSSFPLQIPQEVREFSIFRSYVKKRKKKIEAHTSERKEGGKEKK